MRELKTVKLTSILSTFGLVLWEYWLPSVKIESWHFQRQHLINSGGSNTQNQKGYWKVACFYQPLNRFLARSRRNKIHFPLMPSTLCQNMVFTRFQAFTSCKTSPQFTTTINRCVPPVALSCNHQLQQSSSLLGVSFEREAAIQFRRLRKNESLLCPIRRHSFFMSPPNAL